MMNIPEGTVTPKVVKKPRKRVPKSKVASKDLAATTLSAPATEVAVQPAAFAVATPSPIVKEEVNILIESDVGASDHPITLD